MSREITLLIDGDIIAFTAASAAQKVREDEHGYFQPFAYRVEGEAIVDNLLIGLEQAFKSSHMRVALTDPKANWRRDVWPQYKANRKDTFRPLMLDAMKQYLRDKYGAFHWDSLEADDVLGILNTDTQEFPGERILVGKDKDFLTVPCRYHRIGETQPGSSTKPLVRETTEWQAQMFHLKQTLMGDAVDGYPGCPGIGKTRAEELLNAPTVVLPQSGVITRGVNKGNSTTRWVSEPTRDLWACIVSHYQKGMSTGLEVCSREKAEEAAITTARLAHILRHEDYDRDNGAITLWTPDKIRQQ